MTEKIPREGTTKFCNSTDFFIVSNIVGNRKMISYYCKFCGAEYNRIVSAAKEGILSPLDLCTRLLQFRRRWKGFVPSDNVTEKEMSEIRGCCVWGWFDRNLLVFKVYEEEMSFLEWTKAASSPVYSFSTAFVSRKR